jgi:hypothetical protein
MLSFELYQNREMRSNHCTVLNEIINCIIHHYTQIHTYIYSWSEIQLTPNIDGEVEIISQQYPAKPQTNHKLSS